MAEQRYCPKCKRTMSDVNFYTYKDSTKCELCKNCLTMFMNMYEEDTYLWALEKFDVPYLPTEWQKTRQKEFDKAFTKVAASGAADPKQAAYNMTKGNGVVFGKYLSKMKIKQWMKYNWADSERLQTEMEEKAKLYGTPEDVMNEKIDNIKKAFENGEISEAQYQTYMTINVDEAQPTLEEQFLAEGPSAQVTPITGGNSPYPVNDNPFEKVNIPDVGADLTEEDKIYLAMKWGRLYSAADWVALEKCYTDYEASFDIHNADLEKGLIQLCKLDLKLNQAMDSGDFDSYAKLYRSYDALRKSLKFTEAQNKDESTAEFDNVGAIVSFCEKEGGFIPTFNYEAPQDVIDTIIEDNQTYLRTLVMNDSNLSQIFEQYLKKLELEREMERNGETELTVEDYQEKFEAEMAAITSDEELINGWEDKENEFTSVT